MVLKEKIGSLVQSSAEKLGFLVYDFSIYLKGPNTKITVKLDHEKGITHSDCQNYSTELFSSLDAAEILENYTLEVSSPGINRKLRSIGEYRRFIGAPVKVVYEIDGKRDHLKGKIVSVKGALVKISYERKEIEISFDNIINANLDY